MQVKVIVNGTVVFPDGVRKSSLVIGERGCILGILDPFYPMDGFTGEVIDAAGCYIMPGGIDAHVHLVDGYDDVPLHAADDCYTGTLAALAGGTTTVIDFVCSSATKKECALESIADKKRRASNCAADYAFQYAFTERYEQELQQLDAIVKQGITSFKVFTYYEDTLLDRGAIFEIMEAVKEIGLLKVHAEAPDIIGMMERRADAGGKSGIIYHALTRPNLSELLSVRDMVALHKQTGANICIAHTSAAETIQEKKRENMLGDSFIVETCPHYMQFTRARMEQRDGVLYTMAPPLRGQPDIDALWQGALDGAVDFVATDHCPFLSQQKWDCQGRYHMVPYGVDGIQTRMHYLFSEGVKKRGLSLQRYVDLSAVTPAKLYHMYPKKGCVAVGSDADLIIMDPGQKWVYRKEDIVGNCDYSIYEGIEFEGRIKKVFSRGELVYDSGRVLAEKGRGKFVACN